jgi:uncharacterized membrane protein YphA (DoxX/SURF4 family)
MALSRRIARPLLASIFIVGGLDAVRNPEGKSKKAEAVTGPLSEKFEAVPNDPEALVQLNGAIQIGAGVLLATGRFRRLASLALIGSIIPTTYAGHRFWEETDEVARAEQLMHFLKNLGLLGGLILAAMDTEGEPSLGWWAKRRAHQLEGAVALGRAISVTQGHATASRAQTTASKASKVTKRKARKADAGARRALRHANAVSLATARHANSAGHDAAHHVHAIGNESIRHANAVASGAARHANAVAGTAAREASAGVTGAAGHLMPVAVGAVHSGAELASPYLAAGAERATQLLSKVGEHLP